MAISPESLLKNTRAVLLKHFSLALIFYKKYISRNLGSVCRYSPSCSSYFLEAVNKYGLLRGGIKGCARILKCNPFYPGGYDPVDRCDH